jgi:hypothetical protein
MPPVGAPTEENLSITGELGRVDEFVVS